MDMSNSMKNVAKILFKNAKIIIDRFHVMKNILEDMWALISKIKTKIKKEYLEEQDLAKKEKRKARYKIYENEENLLEIISRWRHQFLKRRKDWNENQHNRWKLFEKIEILKDIKTMYEKVENIFEIFDSSFSIEEARDKFNVLFDSIYQEEKAGNEVLEWNIKIIELENAIKTIKNHFEWILNYFDWRLTNWYAEWLNSRIQRVLSNARWFKDKTYMLYRIIKIFS